MPILQRDGTALHYTVSGKGPFIVFAHSYLCDGSLFAHQVASLQRRWRVINVDLRGHGLSGPALTPVTFEDFADDLVAVLNAEGVDRAVWAGLSMGGFTALRAALKHPQRVAALVLMDTDAGSAPWWQRLQYALLRGTVRAFGVGAVMPRMVALMFGRTTQREQPALCQSYRQRFMQCHVPSILNIGRSLGARDDLLPQLHRIDCPTLVLVGEEDLALPPAKSRALATGIRGAELVVVPRVGHLSTIEAPAVLTQHIERFVDRLAPSLRQAA